MAVIDDQHIDTVAADAVINLVGKPPEKGTVQAPANVGVEPGVVADEFQRFENAADKIGGELRRNLLVPGSGIIDVLLDCRMDV
jgi:hypothetical protein